jgi:hypothetical protein
MEDALYKQSRARFDQSRTYATMVGTLCWVTMSGGALALAVVRFHPPVWGVVVAGGLALLTLRDAIRTQGWTLLYSAMFFMIALVGLVSTPW